MKELNLLRELVSNQPYLQMLGLEVLDAGPGWTKERLPFKPEFLQPYVLHGGVIYSLADTLAAHALATLIYPQEWLATVEQKINFLRPVERDAIVGHGRVVHMGKRMVYSEAEIHNEAGELIAKSTATLVRLAGRDDAVRMPT